MTQLTPAASRQATGVTHPEVILDHVSKRLGPLLANGVVPYLQGLQGQVASEGLQQHLDALGPNVVPPNVQ